MGERDEKHASEDFIYLHAAWEGRSDSWITGSMQPQLSLLISFSTRFITRTPLSWRCGQIISILWHDKPWCSGGAYWRIGLTSFQHFDICSRFSPKPSGPMQYRWRIMPMLTGRFTVSNPENPETTRKNIPSSGVRPAEASLLNLG